MIRVSDLTFRYGEKTALDGVGFEIAPGSFAALLGPNGAGKSTLFGLLTRLFTAPEGRIEIAGHDLRRSPLQALSRLGVVFQSQTLDLDLSVARNLSYFAALQGLPSKTATARAGEVLERLSMAERAHERVRDLNGGHRRRVELARALMHRPEVLLLDEPTVGLDAASRHAITAHVHDLTTQGLTVLWASHLTDEVMEGDRVLVLHRGRMILDGTTADMGGPERLTDRFLEMTGEPA